jgi:hypothetical protein
MTIGPEHSEKQLDDLLVSDETLSCSAAANDGASTHDLTHKMRMAKSCRSQWDTMKGSEDVRQCGTCRALVVKTQDLSEASLSRMFYANEDVLTTCGTTPQLALTNARKGLFRRIDGAITVGDCYAKRRPQPVTVQVWAVAPFVPGICEYLLTPGYVVPFLNHPIARIAIMFLIVWHAFGLWFFSRTPNTVLQTFIIAAFVTPLMFIWVLGPATIQILMALPTIMTH